MDCQMDEEFASNHEVECIRVIQRKSEEIFFRISKEVYEEEVLQI